MKNASADRLVGRAISARLSAQSDRLDDARGTDPAIGYKPNCDLCFHPGIPLQFSYHNHVLTGAPGLGTNATAGQFKGPWRMILLIYNPDVALSPTFTPVMRASDIDPAEAAGTFLQINPDPNAANPYEIETGNVLICTLVSPDA